jgi:hypothetical protein
VVPQNPVQRNRRDHILPKAYLAGFTEDGAEDGRLYAFDIRKQAWLPNPVSPANIGAERGYYDYSEDAAPDATADEAFKEFENKFPSLRRSLVSNRFENWTEHREFLVRYAMMLRARSRLFRKEVVESAKAGAMLQIEEVLENRPSTTRPGETEMVCKVAEVEPRDALFKNMSITRMREEIKKGEGQFAGWHWCLRFTKDCTHPFIRAENAVVLVGFGTGSRDGAMTDPDSLLCFPLCWQACLIGRRLPFDKETEEIPVSSVADGYPPYLNDPDSRFAYSPTPLVLI